MADKRQYAGGGPELQQQTDSLHEYQRHRHDTETELRMLPPEARSEIEDAAYGGTLTAAQVLYRRKDGEIGVTLFAHMVAQGRSVRHAEQVREAKIGAQDMAGAYAARQAQDGPHGAMLGSIQGTAQMLRAPGKMFPRSDILAIIRAEIARGAPATGLYGLLHTFENLE